MTGHELYEEEEGIVKLILTRMTRKTANRTRRGGRAYEILEHRDLLFGSALGARVTAVGSYRHEAKKHATIE
jgi:hypothetical protein